jgi:hypothetical protein
MSTLAIVFITAWFSSGFTVWLGSLMNGEMHDGDHPIALPLIAFVLAMLISGPGVLLLGLGVKMGKGSE